MTDQRTAAQQITEEVISWPGVAAGHGRRGEFAFKLGGREIGHLHGDHAAHFMFPKEVWLELREQRRIVDHPVFPGKVGPAARTIENEADVRDVIELLRRASMRSRSKSPPRRVLVALLLLSDECRPSPRLVVRRRGCWSVRDEHDRPKADVAQHGSHSRPRWNHGEPIGVVLLMDDVGLDTT